MTTKTLPEFQATVDTLYSYATGKDEFVIRKADGELYETEQYGRKGWPTFETAGDAQEFIDNGGLIEVEVISMDDIQAAAGIDPYNFLTESACAKFRDYIAANGIHYYAAEKEEFFRFVGIQQAQKLGLRKVVMENLS